MIVLVSEMRHLRRFLDSLRFARASGWPYWSIYSRRVFFQRPLANFRLGDEAHRTPGVDGENIDPGDVIAHQHHAAFSQRRLLVHDEPHAAELEQSRRPGTGAHGFLLDAQARKNERTGQQTAQQVRGQSQFFDQ